MAFAQYPIEPNFGLSAFEELVQPSYHGKWDSCFAVVVADAGVAIYVSADNSNNSKTIYCIVFKFDTPILCLERCLGQNLEFVPLTLRPQGAPPYGFMVLNMSAVNSKTI